VAPVKLKIPKGNHTQSNEEKGLQPSAAEGLEEGRVDDVPNPENGANDLTNQVVSHIAKPQENNSTNH
jgi:hypothetical protein